MNGQASVELGVRSERLYSITRGRSSWGHKDNMDLAEYPSSEFAVPCSHLTYPMPLGFQTQLSPSTHDFLSLVPSLALPFSQILSARHPKPLHWLCFFLLCFLVSAHPHPRYPGWHLYGSLPALIQAPITQCKASRASISGAQTISPILQPNLCLNLLFTLLAATHLPSLRSHIGLMSH